ncbi:MFS transporter [Tuberibacillus sp. Marseille-P3662]|uniref:MFS transporter n=1 Tax=Tuberibacillus sp. Marseille-P3662 TaxID=1965358 RepID=UPI000A1C9666|nr:MFS transporter [Tuberibacillus sp. Marseille-P3662]
MIEEKTQLFWRTTLALSLGSLVIFANVYFTQPILPVLTEEFAVSPLVSSLSVSFVILALGIALFFYGPISDSIGRRGIMITTMTLATLATLMMVFVPNFESLLIVRILQGICLAGLPSLAVAYIGEEFSSKAIPVAIGVYISGNTIGGMLGRITSGIMTDMFSWRVAFLTMGIISLICLILFIVLLPASRHFVKKPLNWHEALSTYRHHLRNTELRLAYIIGGLHFFIFVGLFNYATYLLSGAPFHLPSSLLGLLFLTYLAGTVSSPIAGRLSAYFSQTFVIGMGITIMVLGLLVTLIPSIIAVIVGLLLICFGFFSAHSVASSWVSSRAAFAKASASGLYLIAYYIGGSLGPFYLDPFWNLWHWDGVIVGCLLVLVVTTFCMWKMYQLEKGSLKRRAFS